MADDHRSSAAAGHTCDECTERGARYYCAADDAFLCSDCDSAVHSANSLARRHHRLRLNAFAKAPSWFTRKLRTPRPRCRRNPKPPLVPNIEASGEEDDDERLIYRVPVLDPALAEFRSPNALIGELKTEAATPDSAAKGLVGFHPSETELMEFAADMESLLCPSRDGDVFSFEELAPKVEADTAMFGIGFGNGSPGWTEEAEKQKEAVAEAAGSGFCLRLDYEAVIAAWPHSGGSPWTNGERPRINLDDCWPWYKGILGGERKGLYGDVAEEGHVADVGREARVTRYREKRRTRLFSKKIRYEVRKLNAEKRPRIKGRFVKHPQAPTGPRFCLSRA